MSDYKVATVYITGFQPAPGSRNCFMANRSNQFECIKNLNPRFRCQSAPFFSCIQPTYNRTTISKFRNKSAYEIRQTNELINTTYFENEFDSAVNLMRTRSNRDILNDKTFRMKSSTISCLKSSQIETPYVSSSTKKNRWKSAAPSINCRKQNEKRNCENIKMLKEIVNPKKNIFKNKETLADIEENISSNTSNASNNNIITSTSNILSNYITIDDIIDIKHNIVTDNEPEKSKIEDGSVEHAPAVVRICVEKEKHGRGDSASAKRGAALRQLMDVYLAWKKGTNSRILAHVGPHQRLAHFHRVIEQRRDTARSSSTAHWASSREKEPQRPIRAFSTLPRLGGLQEPSFSPQNISETVGRSVRRSLDRTEDRHIRDPGGHQNEEEDEDGISIIDWLESDDNF